MADEAPAPGPLPRESIAGRVARAVATLLLVGGVLVAAAALAYGRQAARDTYDQLLMGAAGDIAGAISVQEGRIAVDLPVAAFELMAFAGDDRMAYRVVGPDGATATGMEETPLPPERPRGAGALGPQFWDGDFAGEPARYVAVSRPFAERELSGTVRVIVGQTLHARQALAHDISRRAMVVLAAFGAMMVAMSVLVVRKAVRPMERASAALAARDPYDLTPIPLPAAREPAVMVAAVNALMARLDRQMQEMRDLISDSAHQLRTPVAVLRAQADLAAGERDEARRAAIVARIHDRAVGLGRLLDQMLSRAMVIHRSGAARRVAVDLREIALEVFDEVEADQLPGRPGPGLVLGEVPVTVLADRLSLAEALRNLTNNALAHGQAPVRIGTGIAETATGAEAEIWVEDAGPGPAPEVLAARRRRFAAAGNGRGAGLGLSIAEAVAAAFDGRLDARRPAQGGFRMVLVLPLLAAGLPGTEDDDAA
ncbi:sensor histidine kinase N-terminal domain-containing protein [Frigidibacter sp. MR17.24]|uniref:sensor histidine kinase N-terminal domain-containing protein n=1 Tax=Frigidibacter sp. MR17.24 TaxID=3127345 RepID=UPI0030131743